MTISTTTAKSRYAGDGSTTAFPTGFKFLSNDQVRVLLRSADGSEALWTEGSEYSLSGAGAPGGGTVAVSTSPTDHTPAKDLRQRVFETRLAMEQGHRRLTGWIIGGQGSVILLLAGVLLSKSF